MNIDFSAVDRAVEKVIAKHDALFKYDMLIAEIERGEHPFPANFALAWCGILRILSGHRAMVRAPQASTICENCRCEFCCEKEREIDWVEDVAAGCPVVYCIPC